VKDLLLKIDLSYVPCFPRPAPSTPEHEARIAGLVSAGTARGEDPDPLHEGSCSTVAPALASVLLGSNASVPPSPGPATGVRAQPFGSLRVLQARGFRILAAGAVALAPGLKALPLLEVGLSYCYVASTVEACCDLLSTFPAPVSLSLFLILRLQGA
jgi:hypothetical protein